MSKGKDEWYVSRGGQRFGPVTFAEMVQSARAGRLEPRTDMVIGGGMTEWKPAGEIEGLFERKAAHEGGRDSDPGGHKPPSDSMADSGSYDHNKGQQQSLKLPGATRLGYFLGVTVLPILIFIGLSKAMPKIKELVGADYADWAELLVVIVPIVVIVITVKRFQNLAMTGWWWFGLLVPLLNLWLYYRLFACPPGYAYTRKLDLIGKLLAVVYWLCPVAVIVLAIVAAPQIKKLEEDGRLDDFIEQSEGWIPKIPKLPEKKTDGGSQP